MTFEDLGLSDEVLRAVTEKGYTTPTPIQEKAIPTVLMGRDVLGCAQTGTGKTASFTLPLIDILSGGRAKARMPRALILSPTRELAAQIAENFDWYGKYASLSKVLLIGGEGMEEQLRQIDRGVDVLIATPGRLMDLFERGRIMLNDIKIFVIDEADRMLDMGFIPDIERIASLLPTLRQTLFFSATMPPEIRSLADKFLSNPKEISVAPPATVTTTVTSSLVWVKESEKRAALRYLIGTMGVENAMIFCNRKRDVDILAKSLQRHGFNAGAMHGDMTQDRRTATLDGFRAGSVTLLVCSDVAARGLDIKGVSHVFNYDVPFNAEDYVHRIGRTGRAGREGVAFTLASEEDLKLVQNIERLTRNPITITEIPEEAFAEVRSRPPREGRERGGDRARGGSRGRDRDRGGRDRGRDRDRGERTERPAEHRAERPSFENRGENRVETHADNRNDNRAEHRAEPREHRGERPTERHAERRPERQAKRHSERHGRGHEADDHQVVGFGDALPAFLGGRKR